MLLVDWCRKGTNKIPSIVTLSESHQPEPNSHRHGFKCQTKVLNVNSYPPPPPEIVYLNVSEWTAY
jgi:hypothetical protein